MQRVEDLKYSIDHSWVRVDGENITAVGITDFAQESLGEITFVELPSVGITIGKGEFLCTIASQKTMVDLPAPLSGEVVSINQELERDPKLINESPYESGWLVEFRVSEPGEFTDLMSIHGYEKFLQDEHS